MVVLGIHGIGTGDLVLHGVGHGVLAGAGAQDGDRVGVPDGDPDRAGDLARVVPADGIRVLRLQIGDLMEIDRTQLPIRDGLIPLAPEEI